MNPTLKVVYEKVQDFSITKATDVEMRNGRIYEYLFVETWAD